MKTLAETKDEVAKEHNFKDWRDMEAWLNDHKLQHWIISRMHTVAERLAEHAIDAAVELSYFDNKGVRIDKIKNLKNELK